ncbi:protein disulfide-isomerase TMX3-like isoform X2 [Dysidea avara]|uniref:protein disulfide-isomerase TMX3-like isoform X2 n=1 Tax=Dysidea avara TaxID=196820 RepID=UPI003327D64A
MGYSRDRLINTGLVVILLVVAVSCETDKEKARDGEKSEDSEKVEMMPYVRELTNEFTSHYHEIVPMIIMFYTPWCTHSQRLNPVLGELSKILVGKVTVGRTDVSTYQDLARFFQIKHTPTIVYVKKGKTIVCEQEHTLEGLLRFATSAHGPAVFEVNSTLELSYWMGNYSVFFLLAHDGEIVSHWQDVYTSVAAQKKTNYKFLYTTNSDIVKEWFNVEQFPSLLVIKNGQAHVYDEPVTYHAMSIWIDSERLPSLLEMNISTAIKYTKLPAGKKMVLALLKQSYHKKSFDIIKRLAEGRRFHSGYQFAWTEDDSLITAITGSPPSSKPLLLVWDTEKREFYHFKGDGEFTAKAVTAFLLDVSKQNIKPQPAAANQVRSLEDYISLAYGMCWAMYTHRPILSIMAVIMPLVGIYLFFCGPKKRDPIKRHRPLRNQRQRQRQETDKPSTETIPASTSESQARRRTVDRTSDSNTEDLHED